MSDEHWVSLSCKTCGHWRKGDLSKVDIAAWLRAHKFAGMRPSTPNVTCESLCPEPCGNTFTADEVAARRAALDGIASERFLRDRAALAAAVEGDDDQ